MGAPNFLVEPGRLVRAGKRLVIRGGEAHHILRVRRMAPGDILVLVDGTGYVATGKIISSAKGIVVIDIEEVKAGTSDLLPINLFIALPKSRAMEWLIQKATEIGVQKIQPILTSRCVIRTDSEERMDKLVARWHKKALQALKQCRGIKVPDIGPIMGLEDALTCLDRLGSKLILCESSTRLPLLAAWEGQGSRLPIDVIIGPEGGFTSAEMALCLTKGLVPVWLGERIQRTETAAINAAAALSAFLRYKGLIR